jgi:LPXTG-motif cell wall-anchored protein
LRRPVASDTISPMSMRSVLRFTSRSVGLAAVAGVLSLGAMSGAQAQQYPPASVPPVVVPPASIVPPNSVAPASVAPASSPAAPAKADDPSTPTSAPIPAEVLAATIKPAPAVTVEAANIAASQPAYTGANSTSLAAVGAGLFAAGGALVFASRRRRTAAAS